MGESAVYRRVIDEMVRACREGQAQIGARRAREGVWNRNARDNSDDLLADQYAMNKLLARLDEADREVIATMLEQQCVGGVHVALVILHEAGVPPFDKAYEGSPFHDFMGRLNGWEWPATRERTD